MNQAVAIVTEHHNALGCIIRLRERLNYGILDLNELRKVLQTLTDYLFGWYDVDLHNASTGKDLIIDEYDSVKKMILADSSSMHQNHRCNK
jgi:hypothetical protein